MTIHTSKLIEFVKVRLIEEGIEFSEDKDENTHSLSIHTTTDDELYDRSIFLISDKTEGLGWSVRYTNGFEMDTELQSFRKESEYEEKSLSDYIINALYA